MAALNDTSPRDRQIACDAQAATALELIRGMLKRSAKCTALLEEVIPVDPDLEGKNRAQFALGIIKNALKPGK